MLLVHALKLNAVFSIATFQIYLTVQRHSHFFTCSRCVWDPDYSTYINELRSDFVTSVEIFHNCSLLVKIKVAMATALSNIHEKEGLSCISVNIYVVLKIYQRVYAKV